MTFEQLKPMFEQMNYFELQRTADYLTTRYASHSAAWVRLNELNNTEHMRASENPDSDN